MSDPIEIRKWWIYKITSPSNRVYVGVTSNLANRFWVYRNCLKYPSKQTLVYNSIKKYGYDSHEVIVVESFESSHDYALGREMFWIRSYMSNKNKYPDQNGLNLCDGGKGPIGYKLTPDAVERIRSMKTGLKASEETKRRMSEARIGKKIRREYTEGQLMELSERGKKLRHTEDAKRRIGEAAKGNKYGVGYKMTKEQIEHRSSLLRGQKKSKEAIDKMVKTFTERHSKPVFQYTIDGDFIKRYPSITIASKEVGIPKLGIYRNIKGMYKQSRGFIFKNS